jgi:hypothetical protein
MEMVVNRCSVFWSVAPECMTCELDNTVTSYHVKENLASCAQVYSSLALCDERLWRTSLKEQGASATFACFECFYCAPES